jgi:hypothetical protein
MKTERELVMDLSLLVARMARRLRRNGPTVHDAGDRALADQAVAYLQRHRLTSPLREVDASPPADVPAQVVADSIPKGVDAGKPPQRYDLRDTRLGGVMRYDDKGDWVKWTDVARLFQPAAPSEPSAIPTQQEGDNAGSTGQGDAAGVVPSSNDQQEGA